ncbi:helix-turn-helix domain-containing protein [Pleionea litopenaei]|uniref:Transcriptional regulator n=1 Tax=Pleionea litopenaei TaxID=3070815 RepID=A0AA51X6A1_9GAMM|nr:transcriptional regulator [Pleionea sp. HL-JVS1]WMS86634.1 transcriptional regulator [Pleionea sp. HL-JVS1]
MNEKLQHAIEHWDAVAPLVQRPESERDYESLVHQLEEAMTLSGEDRGSPINGLIEGMAHAAHQYEEKFLVNEVGSGVSALKYLMKVHKIKQSDLKEVGSQGVVSEILNGKRSLTVRHIRALSRRFAISPNAFLEP